MSSIQNLRRRAAQRERKKQERGTVKRGRPPKVDALVKRLAKRPRVRNETDEDGEEMEEEAEDNDDEMEEAEEEEQDEE